MKRIVCTLLCLLLLCAPALAADPAPDIGAAAAVVMHVETGRVLYEKDPDTPMRIASTTKIMTALVVLEHCAMDETVEILPEYAAVEGSSMYLRPGETYTVEDLLYGLMLASGNDAAVALACHTAGSIEAFADLMNAKAADLGLTNTHFCNPHGLDAEGHLSTARDLGALACYAMQNAAFRAIVSTNSKTVAEQTYVNHNKLLRTYDGAVGVKTGYTQSAGRILVSCAEREGTQFVCVTISDPDDWADHEALLDWAFRSWSYRSVGDVAYVLPVISGKSDACTAVPGEDVRVLLEPGETVRVTAELPRFVFAPLHAGETVGMLTVTAPDGTQQKTPLVCTGDVAADAAIRLTPYERLERCWRLAGHSIFSFNPDF